MIRILSFQIIGRRVVAAAVVVVCAEDVVAAAEALLVGFGEGAVGALVRPEDLLPSILGEYAAPALLLRVSRQQVGGHLATAAVAAVATSCS